MAQLLEREFRVFDEEEADEAPEESSPPGKKPHSQPADEEMTEENLDEALPTDPQVILSGGRAAVAKDTKREEREQLG